MPGTSSSRQGRTPVMSGLPGYRRGGLGAVDAVAAHRCCCRCRGQLRKERGAVALLLHHQHQKQHQNQRQCRHLMPPHTAPHRTAGAAHAREMHCGGVRGELMRSQKLESVGESQSGLIMSDPIILSPRTRREAGGRARAPAGCACMRACVRHAWTLGHG
jgi:hypothetical protein